MNSYNYWNNVEIEKTKPYCIEEPSHRRLLRFLREETNIERCFLKALEFLDKELQWNGGDVLDVAAGVCWTSAILSRLNCVSKVQAIDFSEHRIDKYASIVIKQMHGHEGKISRQYGDVLQVIKNEKFDLIVFCQALYMFDDMNGLIKQMFNILRPGGVIMVACERIQPRHSLFNGIFWKQKIKTFVKGRKDSTGRTAYGDREYKHAIEQAGLRYYFQLLDFPVNLRWSQLEAGNYFGIKQ